MFAASDLTAVSAKAAAYEEDESFRAGRELIGDRLSLDTLYRTGMVVAKAESIVTRRVSMIVAYLEESGFDVLAARRVRFDRQIIYPLWKYHWSVANPDRTALAEDLLTVGDALALVIYDRTDAQIPASVRMSALKGSAYPEKRGAESLRSRLGAIGRLLTFVHTSDEPADVLREVSLLFGPIERERLIGAIATRDEEADSMWAMIDDLYAGCPVRELDPGDSARALCDSLGEVIRSGDAEQRQAAWSAVLMIEQAATGTDLPWRRFRSLISVARPEVSTWDPLLVGVANVRHDIPGAALEFRDGGPRDWERRRVASL